MIEMDTINIIKIGGNVIDDEIQLSSFLKDFSDLEGHKILIHGGGKLATELAKKLNIPQKMIEGRRVTDAQTLEVATMVYAGLINKKIVAKLQSFGCNASGFSGADGNLIKSKKREIKDVDYGFVGDILENGIDTQKFSQFFENGITPVICSITHDGMGSLLNTNADAIASEIAKALSCYFEVSLSYCFEKMGVLKDVHDENSLIPILYKDQYLELKEKKIIFEGMIPKIDYAFLALENGVNEVHICHAKNITTLHKNGLKTSLKK